MIQPPRKTVDLLQIQIPADVFTRVFPQLLCYISLQQANTHFQHLKKKDFFLIENVLLL